MKNPLINHDHANPRGHLIAKEIVAAHYAKGERILEIGGQLFPMKKYFPKVTTLDIDSRWKPDILCDAENMKPIKSGSFDLVYSSHFFEHVYNPEKVIREVSRILKPDGRMFFVIPVVHPDRLWLDGDLNNLHQHFFTRKNLRNLCNLAGLAIAEFHYRLWVRPFFLEKPLGSVLHRGDIFVTATKASR